MNKTIHHIALLAFIIGLIAPACGFAWGGKYSVVEICSLDGIKQVVIPNSEDPTEPIPNKSTKEKCSFCFGQKNIDQISLVDILPSYDHALSDDTIIEYQRLVSKNSGSAYNPRAPPFFI